MIIIVTLRLDGSGLVFKGLSPPYDVVLADPPWFYKGHNSYMGVGAEHYYPLMSPGAIQSLPVRSLMSDASALFLWVTCPKLDEGIDTIRSWNLYYRGVAFVWVKTKLDGTPIGAKGGMPAMVKPTTELCLYASTKKAGRPFILQDMTIRQVVFASPAFGGGNGTHTKNRHSEKPPEVRRRIEMLVGVNELKKVELFARDEFPGWDCWGNEVDSDVEITTHG